MGYYRITVARRGLGVQVAVFTGCTGARRADDESGVATPTALNGGGLKRSSNHDVELDDDDDDECLGEDEVQRASKARRVESSTVAGAPAAPGAASWLPRPDNDPPDDVDDEPPASPAPYQTEIKTQRPLGLLAQHRLQTSSYRADAAAAATTGRERGRGGGDETDEQRRLRDMFHGRRLTPAELEAAVAMQERMSAAAGYCGVGSTGAPGLMTSLPPTPSSAAGVDYSLAAQAASGRGGGGYESLMDRRFMPSPPLSSGGSPCSVDPASPSPLDASAAAAAAAAAGQHRHWTFQEQFKQVRD